MPAIEVIIFLLAVLVVLSAIAEKVKIPQFIVLVIAGLAIGFTPGLPNVILRPETVFLIILPPLLFTAAWNISWNDFKARKRPIISLATGLVLFTTVLVAAAAHYLIPHFSWAQGFVLGAIIAPTDAVAAMSVTKSLNLHRKAVTILEGESLLNDASGLVAYRYAIANIVGGGFVVWQAGVQLLWVAAGGISVGLLIGWALIKAQSKIADNPTLEVAFTLLTPYVAYLLAEYIHASGILAVVAAGLYISFRSPESFSFKTRIQAASFWETIDFLLNGCVFILIGMQLPDVVSHIETKSLPIAMGYGLLIAVVAILVRLFWVFPGSYLPVIFSRKPSRMNQALNLRFVVFISWAGMRGVVSLACALAIPLTLADGSFFPGRNLIIFITFFVIFFTLLVQGLTINPLARYLRLEHDGRRDKEEENKIRKQIAASALEYINLNISDGDTHENVMRRLRSKYETRVRVASDTLNDNRKRQYTPAKLLEQYCRLQKQLVVFERDMLVQMHKDDTARSDIIRKLEHELDIEESRLNELIKQVD